jgi:hypothetical protein
MTQEIQIHPGKDDRATNNGFHCAELLFILRDNDSAVTFACLTDWLPAGMVSGIVRPSTYIKPLDLTFHFPSRTLTAEQSQRDACPYMEGACHSIVDRKNGDRLVSVLLAEGSAGVWRELSKLFTEEARINRPRRPL